MSTIITVLRGVTMYLRANSNAQELPLDILAREHPYMYGTALAG